MTRTDAELLQAARQDPTAFREFYDRYAVWMRAWLLQADRFGDARRWT